MVIKFRTSKLERACISPAKAIREWGHKRADLVQRRLDDLDAAHTLADLRFAAGDCHEYRHTKEYLLTLDLDSGHRLFFRPNHDPVPVLPDGVSLDWTQVTAIEITAVENPHE